ncbi:hypothetical protein SISSUDRAFT_1021621 [Sistotremastrum suecicum HHB10207 ss-3]|uniref:Cleavage and polyadenylation specificity factor subunit 2 n=1 Tax=Sistotremastrum suecicum HHB10207 ss-3 TaxID=1314776 RepID=A0A166DBY4_9AGAM|nr:hypothetical protein SISSUDRAFT_1021621 [Sistotremastrum suecicum HHB10207 ss-3]
MITFSPLSGGAASTVNPPLAYLLQVDEVRILLDCGSPDWNLESPSSSSSDTQEPWQSYCTALKNFAKTVDLVLLSHGDLSHSGLYAYARAHWGLSAPAYCTLPVQSLLKISTLEEIETLRAEEDVGDVEPTENEEGSTPRPSTKHKWIATPLEVTNAFEALIPLRYSQPTHLQGKCQGLTITAFAAGHTLGGAIWKIRSPSSGTIIYAVDFNHTRERHLDGTVLLRSTSGADFGVFEPLARPDLLITDADRALVIGSRRKERDATFLDVITTTLNNRHSVLLPSDASTRLLEVLTLLDQHWAFSKLRYPICLVSRTSHEMLTSVRSMMEWLGGTISKEDLGVRENGRGAQGRRRDDIDEEQALGAFALRFKHLELFSSPRALLDRYSSKEPKVLIAVPLSLSSGFSRQIFSEFALIPENIVLLTSRAPQGTLSDRLFDFWSSQQSDSDKWEKGKVGKVVKLNGSMKLKMNAKIPLQGLELEEFQRKEKLAKDRKAAQQATLAREQRMLEADEEDSESDDDSDDQDSDGDTNNDRGMSVDGATAANTGTFAEPGAGGAKISSRSIGAIGDSTEWAFEADDTAKQISYDIYLKGNVSRTTSFFKTTSGTTPRFRMFPFVERKKRIDEFGEIVDVGMWLRKGKLLEEEAEEEDARETKKRKLDEEPKVAETPCKYVSSEQDVQTNCQLLFIDMEGLNDGRAMKTIVPQVNPRKMIIVKASEAAANALIQSCGSIRSMTKDIYAPKDGTDVQIGQHTNSFSISLSDELLATVTMSTVEDSEVGFVSGRVTAHVSSSIPVLEPLAPDSGDLIKGVSEPTSSQGVGALPKSTLIGDLKLTALKSRLAKQGISAEFVGEGILVCGVGSSSNDDSASSDDAVAVRKTTGGQVIIEGTASQVYYSVRKEIYALHAIVGA